MKIVKRDEPKHLSSGQEEEEEYFDKRRRERQIWRHQYPDPLYDWP